MFHPSPCQPAHYLLSQVWQVNADEDVVDSNVAEGFLGQEYQRDFEDQSTNYLGPPLKKDEKCQFKSYDFVSFSVPPILRTPLLKQWK